MIAQTFKQYVASVRAVQWFVCVIPLGGRLLQKQSALAFPPLGGDIGTYIFFAIVISGLAAILPWVGTIQRSKGKSVWLTTLLAVCSVVVYFSFSEGYVVSIPLLDGSILSVTVGSQRTRFAKENFPDKSDAEMLMARGPYENEVRKLWTEESIILIRTVLFGSYLAALVFTNLSIGLIARNKQAMQEGLQD